MKKYFNTFAIIFIIANTVAWFCSVVMVGSINYGHMKVTSSMNMFWTMLFVLTSATFMLLWVIVNPLYKK